MSEAHGPPTVVDTRKRRARVVCIQCHDRKLKCDLEQQSAARSSTCTNCSKGNVLCELRLSGRAPKTRIPKTTLRKPVDSTNGYPSLLPLPMQHIASLPGHQSIASRLGQGEHATLLERTHDQPDTMHDSQHTVSQVENGRCTASHAAYLDGSIVPLLTQNPSSIQTELFIERGKQQLLSPEFQEACIESYNDYCWPWCPVLDTNHIQKSVVTSSSPLLINALALLGTRIRPPMVEHAGSAGYYARAKNLFYGDFEPDPIICLQAILLFYWWAPHSPDKVHRHAAYWWTGLGIKFAQQLGFHREPKNVQQAEDTIGQGLRRRIWWTLFARERLTAICQGRPCTINPADCTVEEPSLRDFPQPVDARAHIFIHWVKLCAIIGRVGQHLSRTSAQVFPNALAHELISWLNGLPSQLHLPLSSATSKPFSRDVHKLHLPYLATIIVLHLDSSGHQRERSLPKVHMPAVVAASSTARIFRDLLARGQLRFLGAISTWYVGVAIVALLSAQHISHLRQSVITDIRTLRLALKELAHLWPTANLFVHGFDRMKAFYNIDVSTSEAQTLSSHDRLVQMQSVHSDCDITNQQNVGQTTGNCDDARVHGIECFSYFPFATQQTSPLIAIIMSTQCVMTTSLTSVDFPWDGDADFTLQDLFSSTGNLDFSFLDTLAY